MRWSAVLAAALLLVSAGCVGSEDSQDVPDVGEDGEDQSPTTSWQTVTRSGTVSGVGTPAGSVSQGGGNMAAWNVPENSRILYLNVTAEGGELSIEYGPDCTTEDTVQCGNQASTEDGQVSLVHEQPNATGWEAYFFLENDAGEVDWTLEATMGVVER